MNKQPWLTFICFFSSRTKKQIFAAAFALVSLLAWLDYITGAEISIALFFIFPMAMVTWFVSQKSGYALVIYALFLWWLSDYFLTETYSTLFAHYWSMANKGIYYVLVVWVSALIKARLEQTKTLAKTDPLTGLINSREFYRLAELELLRASRTGQPTTIAYLDIDNFKKVNDEYGHQTGDLLLKIVANHIQNTLRRTDSCARLGGDEFGLILPASDKPSAEKIIENIHHSLLNVLGTHGYFISFSLGAVSIQAGSRSLQEILSLADALMYVCKLRGKNTFIVVDFETHIPMTSSENTISPDGTYIIQKNAGGLTGRSPGETISHL